MKSYKNLPNNDKDTKTSEFLLAKALYHIEKDEADLYKKPRGKSYRQSYFVTRPHSITSSLSTTRSHSIT